MSGGPQFIEDRIWSNLERKNRKRMRSFRSLIFNSIDKKCKNKNDDVNLVFVNDYVTKNNLCRLFHAVEKCLNYASVILDSGAKTICGYLIRLQTNLKEQDNHHVLMMRSDDLFSNLKEYLRDFLEVLHEIVENRAREEQCSYDDAVRDFVPIRYLTEIIAFLKITSVTIAARREKRGNLEKISRRKFAPNSGIFRSLNRRKRITSKDYAFESYEEKNDNVNFRKQLSDLLRSITVGDHIIAAEGIDETLKGSVVQAWTNYLDTKYSEYTYEMFDMYSRIQMSTYDTWRNSKIENFLLSVLTKKVPINAFREKSLNTISGALIPTQSREQLDYTFRQSTFNQIKAVSDLGLYEKWLKPLHPSGFAPNGIWNCFSFNTPNDGEGFFHAIFLSVVRVLVFRETPQTSERFHRSLVLAVRNVCEHYAAHDFTKEIDRFDTFQQQMLEKINNSVRKNFQSPAINVETIDFTSFFIQFDRLIRLYTIVKHLSKGTRVQTDILGIDSPSFYEYGVSFVELFPWFEIHVCDDNGWIERGHITCSTNESAREIGNKTRSFNCYHRMVTFAPLPLQQAELHPLQLFVSRRHGNYAVFIDVFMRGENTDVTTDGERLETIFAPTIDRPESILNTRDPLQWKEGRKEGRN